jgi:2-polyprenyl-3-methyl-5-hydroxy-6-metoxy-1,4-benzoquinol methylase
MSIHYPKYDELGAYHWGDDFDNWYQEMIGKIPNLFPSEGSVLDVGCGDGRMSYELKKLGLNVTGFDGISTAIRLAKERVEDVDFFVADIDTLTMYKKFDYFLAQDVIEHLKNPDSLVKLFYDNCKEYMILTTDYKHFSLRRYDVAHYDVKDLEKLFDRKVELLFELSIKYGVKIKR